MPGLKHEPSWCVHDSMFLSAKNVTPRVRYSRIHTDMNYFEERIYSCILQAKMHICMYPRKQYRHIHAHMHCLNAMHMCMYMHVFLRHACTYALDTAHMRTKIQSHTGTYMHLCTAFKQCICACMLMYVHDIHAHMHMIQLLCEFRYMQIQATYMQIQLCMYLIHFLHM
jgi:hypothetical protein